jgi:exopolyphosphatase/guanosine-5'-triphosphate,3'-diphosphate pyrophosphatase
MTDRIAIIDLGTNTFHLLIAEVSNNGFTMVHRERLAVKIGKGGINQGIIQQDAITRAIDTLKNFKIKIDQFHVHTIYAFGTSALRNAKNADDVIQGINLATGIDVDIISGDKEAEFIYLGVRSAVDMGIETSLIVDIGGGSVEFIIGNKNEILWKKSIEIGAQRLLEEFQKHDPISAEEITSLDKHFESSFKELHTAMMSYRPTTLVGSSGTFDTLSDMYCIESNMQKSDNEPETPLTVQSFYSIYKKLIQLNRSERMRMPGMIEMRVDMIVVACCLIRYLLDTYDFHNIRVSSYALKVGVLESLRM